MIEKRFSAKFSATIMESMIISEMKEDLTMSILSFIFFGFLSVVAVVGCVRAGKLLVRAINGLFDRIEDRIG